MVCLCEYNPKFVAHSDRWFLMVNRKDVCTSSARSEVIKVLNSQTLTRFLLFLFMVKRATELASVASAYPMLPCSSVSSFMFQ